MSVFQRIFRYFQIRDADRQGDGKLLQMFGGADKADFTRGDVAVFDVSGSVIDGGVPPSSNSGGYGSIYQQVPIGIMNKANAEFFLDYFPVSFTNLAGNQEVWILLKVNGVDQDPYFYLHIEPGTDHFVMRFPPKASDVEMVVRYFRGIPSFTPPPPGVPTPQPPPPPGGVPGCTGAVATYINGPGPGPHKWWRVNTTANEVPGGWVAGNNSYDVSCAELALRSAAGGSDIASGGTPITGEPAFSASPALAFDGDPSTFWSAPGALGVLLFGAPSRLTWLGYEFASPVSIVEFVWTSRSVLADFQVPTEMTLDWSDDGTNWIQGWSFTVPNSCWLAVGPGGSLTFSTGGGPPPGPTSTLAIWTDYTGTVNGLPAISYTLDGGLTWVGGDGTLPGDAGMANPFPSPTFANQKISATIPLPPDLTKFRVRLFIAGTTPASAVNDLFDVFDVELGLNSTNYGAQGPREGGPEPGMYFGRPKPPLIMCQYGCYTAGAGPQSGFSGNCPNFLKCLNSFWINGNAGLANFTFLDFAAVQQYVIRVNGGILASSGSQNGFPLYMFNLGDPGFQDYMFGTYANALQAATPNFTRGTTAAPAYMSLDAFKVVTMNDLGNPDTGYPQTSDEYWRGMGAWFTYAKVHNPTIRMMPHIGSMPDWSYFQIIFADCPAMLRETFTISSISSGNSQFYHQLINLCWFANTAPSLFAGDPATRVLMYSMILENNIHTCLAVYCMVRGPNSFFCLEDSTHDTIDPALWQPTANKLGGATGDPISIVGSGPFSVLQRNFEGGTVLLNMDSSSHTVSVPGGTGWDGASLTSVTLQPMQGEVVLVGTPVSIGVRATRTSVFVGSDGMVTNPGLAIDVDSDPPVTAATITRTNFSPSTVGSVLELSGFGG